MTRNLSRLLNPRSIAVVGGGAWCAAIVGAARRIGFDGDIFPVHPEGKVIAGLPSLRALSDRDGPIDAAFIGVNRHATLDVVAQLRDLGAGGAVCFASGFSEAMREDVSGGSLQAALLEAAGDMPVLGPNCYGFVNALDRAAIWPDQHGMTPVESGVAILTQSSNIAINLTMQKRGLPIAYMVTCGNMAQTSQAQIALALIEDDRVSAIGLHVEGFGDLRDWERLSHRAAERGIPLIALKAGRSESAQAAAISHTASLAGSDAGAQAFLDRLGIARVLGLPAFLETLKLLHCTGGISGNRIAAISCSGGEASLVADLADARDLVFDPLDTTREARLRAALGPMVALANPLDYHTYIWRDADRMAEAWSALSGPETAVTLSIVDYPHTDASDWACATQAAIVARAQTGRPFAVVASLPELMPADVAAELMAGDVVAMMGLDEALSAVEAAARCAAPMAGAVLLPGVDRHGELLSEAAAKADLARYGVDVPRGAVADSDVTASKAARDLAAPLALKGAGIAHKTEAGAVRLNLAASDIEEAARAMNAPGYLVEEMVTDGVAELLIGVTRDPAHGFLLTIGAGGVLTELMQDSVSMLVPSTRNQVAAALTKLRCYRLLQGYRGRPAAALEPVLDTVAAVQDYVTAHADTLCELEINPLICTPRRAVAVDALIRKVP
jgi:acetyl-CoA synthetase